MNKKIDIKNIMVGILILATFFMVLFLLYYSNYYKNKQNSIVLKTQYTFNVRIDSQGNVIKDDERIENTHEAGENIEFSDISIEKIALIWITQFTKQYEQSYVSNLKSISNAEVTKIQVINAEENNVLIAFVCEPRSNVTDYFSSWDGYMTEGKLVCEWVIQFEIEDLYDNTARIFAKSVQLPEDYGLETVKSPSTQNQLKSVTALNANASVSNLYKYEIKNDKLSVTFDGGEKWATVPVTIDNLITDKNNKTTLSEGSYEVGLEKSAFLYGGNSVSGKIVPLTIIYSDDKGTNWTSASIYDILGVFYYYVNFFNQKEGVVVAGYNKKDNEESYIILITEDGGESWNKVGNGQTNNNIIGVNFINDKIGYIDYKYVDGMQSNLYMTTDGGISFTPVILGSQQFEDANTKLAWNSVYKDIQVPILNDEGILTLIVTQGSSGDYNGGDTVAKYESTDDGANWKFVGEE